MNQNVTPVDLVSDVTFKTAGPATILIAEDNDNNRDILRRRLEKDGYKTIEAINGVETLARMKQFHVDLVLLDIMMPEMNGYQVLERMKVDSNLESIPVIVITAVNDIESAVKCIEFGAEDYLPKPFNATLLRARISASLEKKRLRDQEQEYRTYIERYNRNLEERVMRQVRQITSAQIATIFAMSKLAESRDPETGAHLERMREYCRLLAETLSHNKRYEMIVDRQFIDNIYAASPLHDIGKVGVPDHVLLKPGKLNREEWEIMKRHPMIGAETLRAVDRQHPGNNFIKTGIAIAEFHHERWDGSGYPYGLRGDRIPLEARILALGDVYDALTSKRCYKEAFTHADSRALILAGSGNHFDPEIVDAFVEIESEFIRVRTFYKDEES